MAWCGLVSLGWEAEVFTENYLRLYEISHTMHMLRQEICVLIPFTGRSPFESFKSMGLHRHNELHNRVSFCSGELISLDEKLPCCWHVWWLALCNTSNVKGHGGRRRRKGHILAPGNATEWFFENQESGLRQARDLTALPLSEFSAIIKQKLIVLVQQKALFPHTFCWLQNSS